MPLRFDDLEPANFEESTKYPKSTRRVNIKNTLVTEAYDYVGVTYPNSTTEVYIFKTGGVGGTTVATVTVVYTAADKESLSSVTRS